MFRLLSKTIIKHIQNNCINNAHVYGTNVHGRMILRWIFRMWDVGVWTGSSWLRIVAGGGYLWMRSWIFVFREMRGISWLAETRLASQEGLWSLEYAYIETQKLFPTWLRPDSYSTIVMWQLKPEENYKIIHLKIYLTFRHRASSI